jgi:hypothetical protein
VTDGRVDGQDRERLDLNLDGQLGVTDITSMETVRYLTQTLTQFDRADLDGNRRVDSADIVKIQNALTGQVDVNGDGVFTRTDRSRIQSVIEWLGIQYSTDVWNSENKIGLADINHDHSIDIQDQNDLRWAMDWMTRKSGQDFVLDLDLSGSASRTDLIALEEILDLLSRGEVALPEHIELADLNRDDEVNDEDKQVLAQLLSRLEADNTGFVMASLDKARLKIRTACSVGTPG